MRTEVIKSDTIDQAAEEIFKVLKEKSNTTRSVSSRDNVFYFDGWDGLGASAVLRAIAQRLTGTSPAEKGAMAELGFEQVIHIDCSTWESRRALQRAVAEQLKLPAEVMELFDRQDEEDDFCGVAQGSRTEVQGVRDKMYQHIQKLSHRFLLIFYNGSGEEIDLASLCGFSLSGFSTNKVLWTFQGRFRHKPRIKVDMALKSPGTTDTFISAAPFLQEHPELWSYLVHTEAEELVAACKTNTRPRSVIGQSEQVAQCFLYIMEVCCRSSLSIDYDLTTHSANYLVCDGIVHQPQQEEISADDDNDGLWRAAEAMHRDMQLDVDYRQYFASSPLARFVGSKPYWTSPTFGFTRISDRAIPNGNMFQHCSDKLCVLKLSRCTFNFQSPPFICCHNLRFLWLDHCQGTGISTEEAGKGEDVRRCFQRLWVLDVRYTQCDQILSTQMLDLMTQLRELNVVGAKGWDMGQLHGRLPNIRKLRVTKSIVSCSCSENSLFSKTNKLELFDFSGNNTMMSSSGLMVSINSSSLETVIIADGCGFEQISFRGCTKVHNLLLGGWIGLRTLDISGTAVKTLDLATTTMVHLDELNLLGCENLCAILWPPKYKMKREGLSELHIDNTQSAPAAQSREERDKMGTTATTGRSVAEVVHGSRRTSEFPWYISMRDARLLWSLEAIYSDSRKMYVEVSSAITPNVAGGGCNEEGIMSGCSSEQHVLVSRQHQNAPAIYTADSTMDHLQQASVGDGDALMVMWMWPFPDDLVLPEKRCYVHIQDRMRTKFPGGGEETNAVTIPDFVIDCARILHVHDILSTTIFRAKGEGSEWHMLDWCIIKRCYRLNGVFICGDVAYTGLAYLLKFFWASQLPRARYIWKLSESCGFYRIFPFLTFLRLDCCPRMIHVLPLSVETINPQRRWALSYSRSLHQLQTLEVTWCGDLQEVFPLDTNAEHYVEQQLQPVTMEFPSLKHIHLHELPRLHRICAVRMSTPNLETVKIRGCWSLTRLPTVDGGNKAVECDCEKEWWDGLEWEDKSQASRYKPIHSRYYKKTLLRGSVLR